MKTEQELIDTHRSLLSQIEEMKLDIVYQNQRITPVGATKLTDLETKLSDIEHRLIDQVAKPMTEIKTKNVLRMLNLVSERLKLSPEGYSISSDQGTIDDSYIYGCVIADLLNAFDLDFEDQSHPNYYYNTDKHWDHRPLKNFIDEQILKLKSNHPDNYIALKAIVSWIHNQIRELSLRDDQKDNQ